MLVLKWKDGSVLHHDSKSQSDNCHRADHPISAGDLLSPDSVLNFLYPGNHGKKIPNPDNQYQFDTLRDNVLELGHPYLWVQKLGKLHFP